MYCTLYTNWLLWDGGGTLLILVSEVFLLPVNEPPPHAAFEEAAAAVAGVDAVVFPAAGISAHFADQSRAQGFARGWTLGCESKHSDRVLSVSAIHVLWYCFIRVPAICTVSSVYCHSRN